MVKYTVVAGKINGTNRVKYRLQLHKSIESCARVHRKDPRGGRPVPPAVGSAYAGIC